MNSPAQTLLDDHPVAVQEIIASSQARMSHLQVRHRHRISILLEQINHLRQHLLPLAYLRASSPWVFSAENGQWHCRESDRRCAVKTATIPVKTARV